MRNMVLPFLVLLLSGCQPVTVQQKESGVVPVAVRVDDSAYWLEEWYRTMDLPEDQLLRLLEQRRKEFAESPGTRNRLRLALLLTAGPAPVRNQAEAYKILTDIDKINANESELSLAALLVQIIDEQNWSSARIRELKGEMERSQARADELERQLQELTNIEQTIQERDELPGIKE